MQGLWFDSSTRQSQTLQFTCWFQPGLHSDPRSGWTVLGLVVPVLSHHYRAEDEVQRKPNLSRWSANSGPPTCIFLLPLMLVLGGGCCPSA